MQPCQREQSVPESRPFTDYLNSALDQLLLKSDHEFLNEGNQHVPKEQDAKILKIIKYETVKSKDESEDRKSNKD